MIPASAQNWFLDLEDKKTGPFTVDQLLHLLEEAEIPETQRITCDELHGRWITIRELADQLQGQIRPLQEDTVNLAESAGRAHSDRTPARETSPSPKKESELTQRPFTPPPRPPDLSPSSEITRTIQPAALAEASDPAPPKPAEMRADPVDGLFDALQAAKERKAHRHPSQSETQAESEIDRLTHSHWIWIAAGSLFVLGVAGGVTWFFKSKSPQAVASNTNESPPAAPPTPTHRPPASAPTARVAPPPPTRP